MCMMTRVFGVWDGVDSDLKSQINCSISLSIVLL
jgi:hypothetical protein